jgi:glycosyltransferase involved in cell wall biosynthesis
VSPKVQVVLMSYNRPEYISQTIDSIQKQSYPNIDFFISDNSTTNDVELLIKQKYPDVNYLRRKRSLNMSEHWNLIISEIDADYFMMFHDDDVMNPDCVSLLVAAHEKSKLSVACAGNAFIIKNTSLTNLKHNKNLQESLTFDRVFDFGRRYFDADHGGVNPFPGYMYRTSLIQQLRFNNHEAGKHSDVTFLFKALSLGPIVWTKDITMNYRIHDSNDSVGVDIVSLAKLVKFYLKLSEIKKNEPKSTEFIIKNYILWIKQEGSANLKARSPLRYKIIFYAIIKYFLFHPTRFISLLIRRIGLR